VLWSFIHKKNLNGAHDSLVDAIVQMDVVTSPQFVSYINRSASIQKIDEIFTKTQQRDWRKKMEPSRAIHEPWVEQTEEDNIQWRTKNSG
jgi:hypothetical protein